MSCSDKENNVEWCVLKLVERSPDVLAYLIILVVIHYQIMWVVTTLTSVVNYHKMNVTAISEK